MSSEQSSDVKFEIGHVLFIDIVGYSKLRIDQQKEWLRRLTDAVLGTSQVREVRNEQLVRLPTGDGMALVFRKSAEEPVRCALEITQALKSYPEVLVRMGIHSGPVSEVVDLNQRTNIAGAGINIAQRVMDCGDARHILLSKRVADDLEHYPRWQPYLHSLGECEVKHGARVVLTNFFGDEFGNPTSPTKITQAKKARRRRIWAWAAAGLFALLCLTIGSWAWTRRAALTTAYKASIVGIAEKSIAVLPLENLSEEKENAYFADGMQDELLANLGKIKDLKVISRTSVMQYKTGITRNLKEIAQQLGVSKVVEGTVRRSGNRVRVSVQLIDALRDRHIWSENYDRTMADSLTLQGELATEIAAEVGATLSPQEKARVKATPTQNTSAYEAYLRGRALAVGSPFHKPTMEAAISSFQEAVKLDPQFSLAWAYLSRAQIGFYWTGLDPTSARVAAAKDALDHAVALDPSLPETHLAVGFYRYYGQLNFTSALEEFLIAEKTLPNNVDVLLSIGLIQRRLGHWDESNAAMRRRFELDPRNIAAATSLAVSYMMIRHYSDAARIADHILAIEPRNSDGIALKVYTLWAMGRSTEADSLLNQPGVDVALLAEDALHKHRFKEAVVLLSKSPPDESVGDKTGRLLGLGLAQKRIGDTAGSTGTYHEVVQQVTRQIEEAAPDSMPAAELHSRLGMAYAGLGEATLAIAEGKKGLTIQPSSEDPFEGPEREDAMARIYATLGDADSAMPILERVVKIPSATQIVPWHLRLDPNWDPIRNDPRFRQLITGQELIGSHN